ncbi:hypothetical protein AYI87_03395 [Shewanella sp. KCT]|nr:hypothetical protein AYI87_03395 [Shewanella sp. KCT]
MGTNLYLNMKSLKLKMKLKIQSIKAIKSSGSDLNTRQALWNDIEEALALLNKIMINVGT